MAHFLMNSSSNRIAGRDIGGSDPERMSAPRVEEYVRELFLGSAVNVEVISDAATIEKEYPLFAAVDRCASGNDWCNSNNILSFCLNN